jgi:hypothetical protein
MTTAARLPNSDNSPLAAAKAMLLEGFAAFLEKVPEPALVELAVFSEEPEFFWRLVGRLDSDDIKKLSIGVRNQIAFAKGKGRLFEQVKACYELLDSQTTCTLLGISRQALSKKVQAGQVLAFTNGSAKHYPAFQFVNNAVIPEVAKLVREIGVVLNEVEFNVLIGFLGVDMDFSDPFEPENKHPRYALLYDEAAFNIIIRDYKNRFEMGK